MNPTARAAVIASLVFTVYVDTTGDCGGRSPCFSTPREAIAHAERNGPDEEREIIVVPTRTRPSSSRAPQVIEHPDCKLATGETKIIARRFPIGPIRCVAPTARP